LLSIAVLFVLLSGFIHSIWNLFTKNSVNKSVFLWYCQWAAIIIFLPFTIVEIRTMEAVPAIGWVWLVASMVLHGVYVWLLAKAYTIGDLSQVYPIMRGTSPLLVPVFGVLLLNEQLQLIGWVGVLCIVTGIVLIGNFTSKGFWSFQNRAVIIASLVGLMITGYTVVDKVALEYFPPVTLNEATNIGNLMALTYIALKSNGIRQEWRVNWKTILLGGLLAPGGYIIFLKALELMPVSHIAPMREIGTVFGTLLGVFILKERQGKSRIAASIMITIGILVLAWGG
jgi:uncharacterized membrane protein